MPGLSLGLGLGLTSRNRAAPKAELPENVLCRAISQKLCVSGDHKGKDVILAPHVVYHTDGPTDFRLDAVEIDSKKPNKAKLATYKVADLERLTVTDFPFAADPRFNPDDSEYAGKVRCIIQLV